MAVKKGQLLELRVSGMAFGGKGLAKSDGLPVFIDNTVPLDLVIARITKKKKNYAEARLDTIVTPSPLRVAPPCRYSGFCGGCKWQFVKYEQQLIYKQQHVIDSIKHIGLIQEVKVHPTIPSKLIFGYRNKMEFSCSDRRWLLLEELGKGDIDTNFALGLHVPGTFNKVVDISSCLLQPELGNRILADVKAFMKDSGKPVYGLRSHIGFWRFLMLRHSVAYDQWMVNVITAQEDHEIIKPLADLLLDKYPQIVSVINNITSRKAGVAIGEYEVLIGGTSYIKDKIGAFEFEISANSFSQTNTQGSERLYETVKEYVELTGKETVIDLYSGTGAIAIYLADSAKEVTGIEIIESAVADAERNCLKNRVSNCKFILGDIKKALPEITKRPDVMIIDPPRAGMHKDIVKQVLAMAPNRIVYVSCNPATLARDLGMLKESYHVLEVQPVDMFPHTFHIESVARLQRKNTPCI